MSQKVFDPQKALPCHIAFIMDGNRRWARQHFLPIIAGHRNAMKNLKPLIEECSRLGVRYVTFFAFSTENWNRPQDQVQDLMGLFSETLREKIMELEENKVCVRFIGDRTPLEPGLVQLMHDTEQRTKDCTSIQVNIALNYGARWDIAQAARYACAESIAQGRDGADITAQDIDRHISTAGIPDPDLLIRTSGEMRVSNFLLWQLAYTELYFTETLWPDFKIDHLHQALARYQQCERRFGGDAS